MGALIAVDERDRRQRWAAFSVRAHTHLQALATDILLYDRLIIPTPADESEYARFEAQGWRPDEVELRKNSPQGGSSPFRGAHSSARSGEPDSSN